MSDAAQTLTVVIPLRVKPRGGRKGGVTGLFRTAKQRSRALRPEGAQRRHARY